MKKAVLSTAFLLFSLLLPLFSFVPKSSAGANQCTWIGAGTDDNWSTAANWLCSVGTVPATGYDVIFPYFATPEWSRYDLANTNVYDGIWFTGDTGASGCTWGSIYLLIESGSNLQIAGDITADNVTGACQTYSTINGEGTLTLNGDSTFLSSNSMGLAIYPHVIDIGANNLVYDSSTSGYNSLSDSIVGSGNLTLSGSNPSFFNAYYPSLTNSYTGTTTISAGSMVMVDDEPTMFGTTAAGTTLGAGAGIQIGTMYPCLSSGTLTVAESFTVTGSGFIPSFNSSTGYCPVPSITTDVTQWWNSFYEGFYVNFSGNITLNSNIYVSAVAETTTFSGNISGSGYSINVLSSSGGQLIINGLSNNTLTSNGNYETSVTTHTYSDSLPAQNIVVGAKHEVTITGQRADVEVLTGGTLKGTGTVASLMGRGGIINPGTSPGVLNTGNVTYDSATTMDVELEGTGAGQYDQLNVTGTVSLGSATLNTILFNGYTPSLNDAFTIINNDGVDAVTGTFAGLAQGATVMVGTYQFTISYTGGTGNDVVLTTSYEPGPPGTGFDVFQNSLLVPSLLVITGAVVLLYSNRKLAKVKSRR